MPSEKYQEVLQRRKCRYDQQIRGALVELLNSAFDCALSTLQIEWEVRLGRPTALLLGTGSLTVGSLTSVIRTGILP